MCKTANQVEILSKFQNVLAMKVDYQENRFLRQNILIFRVTSTNTKLCTNCSKTRGNSSVHNVEMEIDDSKKKCEKLLKMTYLLYVIL